MNAGLIEKFKSDIRAWWTDIEKTAALKIPVNTDMSVRRDNLMKRARYIREKIESFPGLSNVFDDTGLGVWPLLVGGTIATAAAWAYAQIKITGLESKKIQFEQSEYMRLVNAGQDPKTAAGIAFSNSDKKDWSDVAYKALTVAPWIMGAIIVHKVFKQFRG